MTFPDRLRQLREESGLSQRQLADRAGLSLTIIRFYEYGKSGPPGYSLFHLADALHVSMDYLYGRTDRRDVD